VASLIKISKTSSVRESPTMKSLIYRVCQ